jgi:Domain of unknown function (DUF4407)
MSRPGQFLITLSGARPDILVFCPGERVKFQSLGWVILITAGMAVISMWFALTSTLGVNAVVAVFAALVWGLVIMGIDRWLVTSMPQDRSRKLLMAIPRLALAVLLGSVISTPFVLRIFASEINNQISVIKENNEAAFLTSQQRSSVGARVSKWQNTVTDLQQVIDSHGAQPINPADDPVIQGLNTELTSERAVAATDYKAWQCQLYGGCGAPKGSGPLAEASQQRYDSDEAQIASLTTQISARKQELQASSASSQASRLEQAQSALPNAQAQLAAAEAAQNTLLNNFQVTNGAANGLLIRLEALDQLSAKGGSLAIARWLLFLLFLVIELLPVSVKLLQQPGLYEQVLAEKDRYELREAKWRLRSGAGLGPQGELPAGQDAGTHLGGGFRPRPPARHVSTGELIQLFERTQTAGVPPSAPALGPAAEPGDPWRGATADLQPDGPDRFAEEPGILPDGRPGGPAGAAPQGRYGDFGVADGYADDGYGDDGYGGGYGDEAYGLGQDQVAGVERVYSDDDL